VAARPSWEGHLRLSLVTCPVALYKATEPASGVSFNLIDPETNERIRMQTVNVHGEPVERSSLVKGYQFAKNQDVLIEKDELEALKLESTKVIDIEQFVDVDGIDRLYWDEPYYLAPQGKTGIEAFAVIQEAMRESGKLAIGRLVMSARERICAIEPRGDAMVLTTIRAQDEVRDLEENVPLQKLPGVGREMLAMRTRRSPRRLACSTRSGSGIAMRTRYATCSTARWEAKRLSPVRPRRSRLATMWST
jgi:DNA end-binding protein Ku